jgi:hypothetical protein
MPENKIAHQLSICVVPDCCLQRDTGIGGEVADGTNEAESIGQVQGDSQVVGIDRDDLIVDLRIIDVPVGG